MREGVLQNNCSRYCSCIFFTVLEKSSCRTPSSRTVFIEYFQYLLLEVFCKQQLARMLHAGLYEAIPRHCILKTRMIIKVVYRREVCSPCLLGTLFFIRTNFIGTNRLSNSQNIMNIIIIVSKRLGLRLANNTY